MKSMTSWLLMVLLVSSAQSFAADNFEQSIVIRHSEGKTYYEYTVNGEVKEIKVVPKVGPAYYLIPAGENDVEFKRKTQSDLVVPKWVIFSW